MTDSDKLTIEVPITNYHLAAVIDSEDAEKVLAHNWFLNSQGYPAYGIWRNKQMRMHHLIVGMNPDGKIDHINGNTLDNRKCNLRFASNTENARNRRKTKSPTSSKYKGVSFYKNTGKWRAYIKVNKKFIALGSYELEVDAAKAYNAAALLYHKDYANLNVLEYNQHKESDAPYPPDFIDALKLKQALEDNQAKTST